MVGCQSGCSLRLMLVPMAPRPSSSPCWPTWASPWPSGTASGHARCPRQCGCRPHPAAPPDRPRAGPVPSPGTRRPPRRAGRPAPRQACDCGRPVAPHQAAPPAIHTDATWQVSAGPTAPPRRSNSGGTGWWPVPQPTGSAPPKASGALAMPQLLWHRTAGRVSKTQVAASLTLRPGRRALG
jgi:hypothetical protein